MLRSAALRVLDDDDRASALALLDADPAANVFVAARVHAQGLDPWRLGGEMWGWTSRGRLRALCYAGANFVPVGDDPDALQAFADRARRQGRRCSSLVGETAAVGPLWELLEPGWGPARDVRPRQPLMVASKASAVPPDPLIRRVRSDELDILLPACVAMFTEEVGVPPSTADRGANYRARINELILQGRAYARIENGRVVFKAELGAVTPYACQVQGVWVDPPLRGRGLSVGGMAAVLNLALANAAPLVSLYVNDYNLAALAAYRRVGFRETGTFMSVLF
ncbi:MAG: GNAT family N-acetyltransferase [Actinomycetota bacterium]|jgi:predicted GNAT family acetyltransferase|nr:GNAT family N-acetyltransferase [Acidothermales bacterium]MDQ3431379.1 GNAT family N-acetyltransferase [Actinomycetota bacterium]